MTPLQRLVEDLRGYRCVVVCGTARSGTHIGARILAEELGKEYIEELDYDLHDRRKFFDFIYYHNACVQCAGPFYHGLDRMVQEDYVAVVFIMRDLDEIKASQERIGWRESMDSPVMGNKAKQDMWMKCYASHPRCFTFNYNDFATHPLWKPKEKRVGWKPNQTE